MSCVIQNEVDFTVIMAPNLVHTPIGWMRNDGPL
jgi:hypothetical protein